MFRLQLSAHCKKTTIQFTSLIYVNSFLMHHGAIWQQVHCAYTVTEMKGSNAFVFCHSSGALTSVARSSFGLTERRTERGILTWYCYKGISEMQERDHVKKNNSNQNVWIFFLFWEGVQDRPLNKCNFFFFVLLISLHTFIKTTTDYNLTICVKKETPTKLQTRIEAVFFPANCTAIFDYLDESLASISPVTVNRKKVDYIATPYLQYIIYIFIYIYITLAVIMTWYIHEHH